MATDFGTLLRDLREKGRVSMGTLARELSISVAYLSDVERGYRAPFTRDRIVAISRVLNVDPTDLLLAASESRGYYELPVTQSQAGQSVGAALMRGWPDLTDDDFEKIRKILEAIEK